MADWIKTDDDQWVKKICDKSYELVEVRDWPISGYVVVSGKIDLDDYTEDEITSCIKGYGYDSIESLKTQYGDTASQVIAECIFEQTSEMELDCLTRREQEIPHFYKWRDELR